MTAAWRLPSAGEAAQHHVVACNTGNDGTNVPAATCVAAIDVFSTSRAASWTHSGLSSRAASLYS